MKTTKQRLMELAGLREARSIEELMDMAKKVKGFKKLSDTKFQIKARRLNNELIMQVEPIQGKPEKMLVKFGNDSVKPIDTSVVYNIIYNAEEGGAEDFNNDQLGSKSTKTSNEPTKGIKVQDDEGEAISTLTDVSSAADLMRRIEKEPEEYQQVWAEIPYAFDVVGPDSMYNTTEEDVEDLEHYPPTTYEKWIKGYRNWAKDVLAGK